MKIDISGESKILTRLGKIPSEKLKIVVDTVITQALFLESEVKESIAGQRDEPTSVDTGYYLNSPRTDVEANNKGIKATVSSDVDYAQYLEFETSKIKARPHYGNSYKRNKVKIVEKITQAVAKSI